jgi:predicted dehydrogenase
VGVLKIEEDTLSLSIRGAIEERDEIRAGLIGCGSHAFRNILPTFQFASVRLAATCDVDVEKAREYARAFGADHAYADFQDMLREESLDAVFVVLPYNERGRPMYPEIAEACLKAGVHVWIEKPPAATTSQIELMADAARAAGKNVMVGFKKMFFPANEKARTLMGDAEFGEANLVLLQYPQYIPTRAEFEAYAGGARQEVVWFLDHLCHPVSLLIYLLGMPSSLYYERSATGAGAATFTFGSGAVAVLSLTHGQSQNGGMERTTIVGDSGRHITVENNHRVTLNRTPPDHRYGAAPTFYTGDCNNASAVWEPEFSLGVLYNKGLFLLGYYNEIEEFARSVLENRAPSRATLADARRVTAIFEAFAEGPGVRIALPDV